MRPEVTLGLVAGFVPAAKRWRCLVCTEMAKLTAPTPAQLVAVRILAKSWRSWRRFVRPPPRRRVDSWRRRLHDMEEPILLCV